MQEKDIPWGKFDTLHRLGAHGRGGGLHRHRHRHRAARRRHRRRGAGRRAADEDRPLCSARSWPSACSTPGCSARSASRWPAPGRSARSSAGRTRSTTRSSEAPWFYASYFLTLLTAGAGGADSRRAAGADHAVRPGHRGDAAAGGAGIPDPAAERQGDDGRVLQQLWQNLIGGFIVVIIVLLSTLYGISAHVPDPVPVGGRGHARLPAA